MISIAAFGFTGIPTNEKDAKQFARDLVVLLNGGAESATLVNKITVRRFGPDEFKSKKTGTYDRWTEPDADHINYPGDMRDFTRAGIVTYTSAQLATEALKFANATPEPQMKVVAALTKHLRRADALF